MPYSILIVDDDKELVEEIAEILTDEGFLVSYAHDGITGLKMFDFFQPELVILDMKMPKMNGDELIPILKEKQPATPVIMISGRPVNSYLPKTENADNSLEVEKIKLANKFISKPFQIEELIQSIKSLLFKPSIN